MQCNGEAVLLKFGVWFAWNGPVGNIAIGAFLRGIRYFWMTMGCTMGGWGF
jgi:hypothetical protein